MFKKILLSLLITVPTITQAEWILIDKDEEYSYYIDPARTNVINNSQNIAETWIKSITHSHQMKNSASAVDYRLSKFRIKCKTTELLPIASYSYKNNKVVGTYKENTLHFTEVVPESRGEVFVSLVCKKLFNSTNQ
ncbi:surface-adhesin E family protein [Acinetobacter faecalis]|uniref:surface-adhesin E family protein n=1 Tax=Acinetobacter faecalis TaxID=2665161 RepID=UPI002A918273|nr:surface-adhesin E family protein [Acinetobacter faecalis]MDY6531518.1 hypothetical protein [Acinetobacter faecalis]